MKLLRLPLLLAIGWLTARAAVAAAAAGSASPVPGFGEVLDVEVVNVQVWVTDRQGQPVSGLTAKDFVLRHDGKPVPITHFAEIREGGAVGGAESVTPIAPRATTAAEPAPPAPA